MEEDVENLIDLLHLIEPYPFLPRLFSFVMVPVPVLIVQQHPAGPEVRESFTQMIKQEVLMMSSSTMAMMFRAAVPGHPSSWEAATPPRRTDSGTLFLFSGGSGSGHLTYMLFEISIMIRFR